MGRPKIQFDDYYEAVTESGCWLFTGGIEKDGYGQMTDNVRAHRAFYEHFVGRVPTGLQVLHKCDVRCCVNPAHLFLGTTRDNTEDAVKKHRTAYGEHNHNAKLTADQAKSILVDPRSQNKLAKAYGVTRHVIALIKQKRIWRRALG